MRHAGLMDGFNHLSDFTAFDRHVLDSFRAVFSCIHLLPSPPGLKLLREDVLSLPLLNFISQKVQTWPACKKNTDSQEARAPGS